MTMDLSHSAQLSLKYPVPSHPSMKAIKKQLPPSLGTRSSLSSQEQHPMLMEMKRFPHNSYFAAMYTHIIHSASLDTSPSQDIFSACLCKADFSPSMIRKQRNMAKTTNTNVTHFHNHFYCQIEHCCFKTGKYQRNVLICGLF